MRHTILISSGTGPLEVREFVGKLALQVECHSRENGLAILDVVIHGDESAPSFVEFSVEGQAALVLGDWLGTHELVAKSDKRSRNARKRWFAGISLEATQVMGSIEVNATDVEFLTSKAGGPGGQHVNTSSSAVRAHHIPSGIQIRVTEERSQHANKRKALLRIGEILAGRLQDKKDKNKGERHLQHRAVVRGNAVKSWTLHQSGSLVEKA